MNDTSPRCAASGTTCRLLQLETPGARPVWAVLDAAGARRFTGEITLASRPQVRAWFHDGAVYYAERAGDPSIGDRLIEYGVLTPEQLAAGTVQLGAIAHLGRLFDRVPSIERDPVELVLEVVTGEVLGEIADHTVDEISIASYRHHPSGVSKWRRASQPTDDAPATGEVPVIVEQATLPAPAPADLEPTAADHELVAEYEQLMSAPIGLPLAVGEPTQQLVVDESLRILESPTTPPTVLPTVLPTHEAPALRLPAPALPAVEALVEAPVQELVEELVDEPVAELVAELVADAEPPEIDADAADEQRPFTFEFDLEKVLAQVALENDGLPMGPVGDTSALVDEISNDVRAAVRAALAEIEAAARPAITHGLSSAAIEDVLDTAPESPADIEPGIAPEGDAVLEAEPEPEPEPETDTVPMPWLRDPGAAPEAVAGDDDRAVDAAPAPTIAEGTGGGLRRLIGGSRKP